MCVASQQYLTEYQQNGVTLSILPMAVQYCTWTFHNSPHVAKSIKTEPKEVDKNEAVE